MMRKATILMKAKGEPLFFSLIILLTALPVLRFTFFPTLDGPAHLYNSNLLQIILFGSDPVIDTYYKINTTPVPNWFTHVFLALFNGVLPAFLAEKVLLLLYVAGLPLLFRYMVLRINPSGAALTYLIFPFVYSFMLHLGLYNFCFSVILVIVAMHYWNRVKGGPSILNMLILMAIVTVVFFAHVITWGILFIALCFISVSALLDNEREIPYRGKNVQRSLTFMVIGYLPSAALFVEYLGWIPKFGGTATVSVVEKVKWLQDSRAFIGLDYTKESFYTSLFFFLVYALTVILLFRKVSGSGDNALAKSFYERCREFTRTFFSVSDHFLFTALSILVLFFLLPSTLGFIIGGFVTEKLCFLFYLFMVLWLAAKPWPRWIGYISIALVLWIQLNLMVQRWDGIKELNDNAVECVKAAEKIEPGSTVLPVNYSINWLHAHFSNYLGIEKPLVILENFQANDGYFPLAWKHPRIPNLMFGGNPTGSFCVNWITNANNPPEEIDYILVWGDLQSKDDECAKWLRQGIEKYTTVYSTEKVKLYKLPG